MYTTNNLKIYIINVNINYTESYYLIVIKLHHHNDNGNTIKT